MKKEIEYAFDDREEEVKAEKPIPLEIWKKIYGDKPYPEKYKNMSN